MRPLQLNIFFDPCLISRPCPVWISHPPLCCRRNSIGLGLALPIFNGALDHLWMILFILPCVFAVVRFPSLVLFLVDAWIGLSVSPIFRRLQIAPIFLVPTSSLCLQYILVGIGILLCARLAASLVAVLCSVFFVEISKLLINSALCANLAKLCFSNKAPPVLVG